MLGRLAPATMTSLEIGRIGKAHGLRGEVTAVITSDRPERTAPGAVWFLDETGAVVDPQPGRGDVVALANDPTPQRLRDALAAVPDADRVEVRAPTFDPGTNRITWRLLAVEQSP